MKICPYCQVEVNGRTGKIYCSRKHKELHKRNKCNCGNPMLKNSSHCRKCHQKENVPNWKGDKVGYAALHDWIRIRKIKPKFCEHCNIVAPKELANMSGKYKRDITDFKWLCQPCHRYMDWQKRKKWDKEEVQLFIEETKRLTVIELMKKYNMTKKTIYELTYRFKKFGGTGKHGKDKLPNKDQD